MLLIWINAPHCALLAARPAVVTSAYPTYLECHRLVCLPQVTYEDSMDLIAKLPTVAAIIYRNLYRDGSTPCAIDTAKDWSWNFTSMLGYEDPEFVELMRLYLTIHRLASALCCEVVMLSVLHPGVKGKLNYSPSPPLMTCLFSINHTLFSVISRGQRYKEYYPHPTPIFSCSEFAVHKKTESLSGTQQHFPKMNSTADEKLLIQFFCATGLGNKVQTESFAIFSHLYLKITWVLI